MSTSSATTTYYAETGYANPHAVTSVGGTTYTYDNNGDVTAIGSLDYTWDWRNRLASAERSGGGITSYVEYLRHVGPFLARKILPAGRRA